MNVSLILAAGGSSQRFLKGRKSKKNFSKLFLTLGSKPLLAHTLEAFHAFPQIREIILAVPRGTENYVKGVTASARLKRQPGFTRNASLKIIAGGRTRAESVWKALQKTSPRNQWVLVHDGARPFPPRKEIMEMLEIARRGGASPPTGRGNRAPTDGIVLGKWVVPTIKRVNGNGQILGTVDRSQLFEAETPQLVRRSVLIAGYRENPKAFETTDESSLVEAAGGKMKVKAHTGWNIKITSSEDLKLANAQQGKIPVRVGFGRDTHRLVEGLKFFLGGVRIPFEKGALGHSDGDALLHAAADAVLGAVGLGDIGEWFSDRNPRHKGIRSEKILRKVLDIAQKKGWEPAQLDSVITLERPRLGSYKKKIRRKIAQIMDLSDESVSVKAKTAEGLGPEGEGRAVTCEAIVLMKKVA